MAMRLRAPVRVWTARTLLCARGPSLLPVCSRSGQSALAIPTMLCSVRVCREVERERGRECVYVCARVANKSEAAAAFVQQPALPFLPLG